MKDTKYRKFIKLKTILPIKIKNIGITQKKRIFIKNQIKRYLGLLKKQNIKKLFI